MQNFHKIGNLVLEKVLKNGDLAQKENSPEMEEFWHVCHKTEMALYIQNAINFSCPNDFLTYIKLETVNLYINHHSTALNTQPLRMMKSVTVPKKMPMSFHVITFLRSVASGNDSPTTPIIKAMAVPRATPF